MRDAIPLSVPVIRGNEWRYIKDCLDTGWVSSAGKYVISFEEKIAEYVGSKYAVATVNGTAALHVSLIACGVGQGDEIIVPALTFIASVNVVKYCGAEPVFMDCDHASLCMDIQKTTEFIEKATTQKRDGYAYNKKTGRRIKAIIPVHIFGHPVDMDSLIRVCSKRNIDVIEDATESLGSEYKGKKTGAIGRVGCFSFNGNKIITTGGGGMIVTNDKKIGARIRHLTTQARRDPLEYDHDEIGYNYRLTNIQAAMGIGQMENLNVYINTKRQNARLYRELLSGIDEVELLWEEDWAKSNFWLLTIRSTKKDKNGLIEYLLSKGIQVRPIWKPINNLRMYKRCQAYKIENALKAYDTCLSIPSSVSLKKEDVSFIVNSIKRYFLK